MPLLRRIRGCGARVEGGLYLTAASEPLGCTVECFLIDPPVPWTGPRLRAPLLYHDGRVYHVVIGVGKTYYPSVPDFVEEVRVLGLSKRIPIEFDFTKLTPLASKVILVHPRAIPLFGFDADFECPARRCLCGHSTPAVVPVAHKSGDKRCIGALWPLRALIQDGNQAYTLSRRGDTVRVETPWGWYEVKAPRAPAGVREDEWMPGIFAVFHVGRIEYVSRRGEVPRLLLERAKVWEREKGGVFVVVPE